MGIRKMKVKEKQKAPKILPTIKSPSKKKNKLSKEDETIYKQFSALNDLSRD